VDLSQAQKTKSVEMHSLQKQSAVGGVTSACEWFHLQSQAFCEPEKKWLSASIGTKLTKIVVDICEVGKLLKHISYT